MFLKQAVACMAAGGQYLALHKRAIQALAAESDGRAAGRSAGRGGRRRGPSVASAACGLRCTVGSSR